MATIVITLDGNEHTIRSGDLTAIDAKDFRAKVGQALVDAFHGGVRDLDVVAGLVWLDRRRLEPQVTFERIALAITYDSQLELSIGEEAANGQGPEEHADPET